MPAILPPARPRLSSDRLHELMRPFAIDRTALPLVIIGIRGYYRDTMGVPARNDRGIYDDALFIDTINTTTSFNANTDPSRVRKGRGTGAGKGMASLQPGLWMAHKFDIHNGSRPHKAICQRLGPVKVMRDGVEGDYSHEGNFGINIHRGGVKGTSSEGCQTVHPDQWRGFYELAKGEAVRFFGDRWDKVVIPYLLLENHGEI